MPKKPPGAVAPVSPVSATVAAAAPPLKIELRPVTALKPSPNNPRRHSAAQIAQIAASIREFGFINPLLTGTDGSVIAGQGRLEAARQLGMTELPVVPLAHLSAAQRRAYVIADNRLAEKSSWDQEILAIELQGLMDDGFEIQLTGFSCLELDQMVQFTDAEDDPHLEELGPPVSRLGDMWLLDKHRLYCGDSTLAASYATLLGDERAQMVFTDPPYNVRISGHVTVGKGRHSEFEMASGEMTSAQFKVFLTDICERLVEFSVAGSIHYICMDFRHLPELLAAGQACYSEFKNLCIWNKDNGGMGSLYRSKHELILVYKHGTEPHINNVELGKHGRNRTNVWDYPGANSGGRGRLSDLAMHPTVKPVAMIADAMLDCSHRDGLVLDAFGGSGSTLLAAQRTKRRAALIELDPKYVDVAVRRYERQTGSKAVLAGTGLSFDKVAAQRQAQAAVAAEEEVDHGR